MPHPSGAAGLSLASQHQSLVAFGKCGSELAREESIGSKLPPTKCGGNSTRRCQMAAAARLYLTYIFFKAVLQNTAELIY